MISRVVIPLAYRDEDLAIQIIAATLVLFHQLRLEVSVPVSGNLKWNLGCVCFQRLWRVAVSGVPVLSPAIRFLIPDALPFSKTRSIATLGGHPDHFRIIDTDLFTGSIGLESLCVGTYQRLFMRFSRQDKDTQ